MSRARSNGKNFLLVFLVIVVFGLSAIVIWMGMSRPESSTTESTLPALVQSTAEVSLDHAILVSMKTGQIIEFIPGDVTVLVPAGATKIRGSISIINREPDMFPDAGEPGWTRPMIVNVEYLDEQGQPVEGIQFNKPLKTCFGMTDDEWQTYAKKRPDYQIQTYDESSSPPKWVALSLMPNPDQYQLCGKTDHLSLFALAIKGILPPTETPNEVYEP